ncbi:MAG: erythromycin esterase family protein [Cytophagales bacterium]|nr:erythromycin esterase family protein [Cytophagales bacterium]
MKQLCSPNRYVPKCVFLSIILGLIILNSCKEEELPADRRHVYEEGSFCERTFEDTQLVEEELNQLIYPLEGSSPGLSMDALVAIGEAVGDTPLVGLGEATHGTKEHFEMKDRLFRYLVENHGFRAMGFEATWGGALYVNDYVVNGNGTAKDAIGRMQFWTWYTEEVQALVEWMRDYNLDKSDDEKVYFYGFDMQSGVEEPEWIERYLLQNQPALVQQILPNIREVLDIIAARNYQSLTNAQRNNYRSGIRAAQTIFEANSASLIASSSQSEYDLMLKAFDVLLQFEDYSRPEPDRIRDDYMAENSEWIREYLGEDTKVALWAHNGHVTKDESYPTQGQFLEASVGEAYKNIGFSFNTGKFQALDGDWRLNTENEVTEIRCNTVNEVFEALTDANFYLVMADLTSTIHAKEYFSEDRDVLSIGALYDEANPNSYYRRYNLAEAYDVIVHFEVSTSAVPLR